MTECIKWVISLDGVNELTNDRDEVLIFDDATQVCDYCAQHNIDVDDIYVSRIIAEEP